MVSSGRHLLQVKGSAQRREELTHKWKSFVRKDKGGDFEWYDAMVVKQGCCMRIRSPRRANFSCELIIAVRNYDKILICVFRLRQCAGYVCDSELESLRRLK